MATFTWDSVLSPCFQALWVKDKEKRKPPKVQLGFVQWSWPLILMHTEGKEAFVVHAGAWDYNL